MRNILIVEDELLVALDLEDILTSGGFQVLGFVADRKGIEAIQQPPVVALVDLNLRDGPTGNEVARALAQQFGTRIIFVTANPAQLGDGVPGALGVVSKPCDERLTAQVISFAEADRRRMKGFEPPPQITLFQGVGR